MQSNGDEEEEEEEEDVCVCGYTRALYSSDFG